MERLTKDALIARIAADRARFDEVVSRVPRERLTEPILPGGWSVKDVLAHIAWGEREGIGVMRERALVGSELWDLTEDERNAAVVRESRSRDVDEVLREYGTAFAEYVSAITLLSDEDLNGPERIRGLAERIPGWPPWRVLYDPNHYEEHGRTIEAAFAT
jgi:uncharacterized protein (TIGR03083 family)